MAGEKFIALEETSQEIKASVDNVKSNVDGLKTTDVPAIEALIKNLIGSTDSQENMSSKLDSIITMLSSNFNAIDASDNLLLTILNGQEISAGSSSTGKYSKSLAGTFHTDLTGKIRIRTQLKFPSDDGSGHAALYRGDILIAQSNSVHYKNASNYTIVSFDADVNAGNDYSIYVEGAGSAGYRGTCYMNLAEVRGTYTRKNIDYIYKI